MTKITSITDWTTTAHAHFLYWIELFFCFVFFSIGQQWSDLRASGLICRALCYWKSLISSSSSTASTSHKTHTSVSLAVFFRITANDNKTLVIPRVRCCAVQSYLWIESLSDSLRLLPMDAISAKFCSSAGLLGFRTAPISRCNSDGRYWMRISIIFQKLKFKGLFLLVMFVTQRNTLLQWING